MESIGASRLAELAGKEPGEFMVRYAILDYSSLKSFCDVFEIFAAGAAKDQNGR